MKYELPELGYGYDALEPFIDKETMEIHHSKHHQGYVDKLNVALENGDLEDKDMDELISDLGSIPDDIRAAVQNNGGGHSNHSFFWKLLKKDTKASGELQKVLHEKYQSGEAFEEAFTEVAMKRFGSGWAWVVVNEEGELEIMSTPNQDSPLSEGKKPVIGLDVWEHAYYLKYQNKRPDYIKAFFEVLNWEQAEENYKKAKGGN